MHADSVPGQEVTQVLSSLLSSLSLLSSVLSSQTRALLLGVGRRSLGVWVYAGVASQPGLRRDVERAYDRLATQAAWPDQQVNRLILVFWVLPMAALYIALRERGRTEQQAVEVVTRAVGTVIVGPERVGVRLLARTGGGRWLIMRGEATTVAALRALGGPAWEATFVERSASRMAVDVTRCYIRDTLATLDAAPAVMAMCSHDVSAFADLCPQLRLSRTGTLGEGADRCDFCLELLPAVSLSKPGDGAERPTGGAAGGLGTRPGTGRYWPRASWHLPRLR